MQRQTVMKRKKKGKQSEKKYKIQNLEKNNMHSQCISKRNTEYSVHFMQQTMRTQRLILLTKEQNG